MIQAEITGLMAYTNYTVQVAAVNDQGEQGPLSQPVSIFTPEAGTSFYYSVHREVLCTFNGGNLACDTTIKPPQSSLSLSLRLCVQFLGPQ